MKPFSYTRAQQADDAIALVTADPAATYLAGGTELVNWLKDGLAAPSLLVDINALKLGGVEAGPSGLRIGALARMSDLAAEPAVRTGYPVLAEALLAGASPQLRNAASIGGNLLQRTRCPYFRETSFPCNRRNPGSGCAALSGHLRESAIFGASERCIAVHPSDLAVALVALDAVVHTRGPNGQRTIPIGDFHLLPGSTPEREHPLDHGELIVAVEVPAAPFAAHSHYLKIRDRASYEFALVSVAVAVELTAGTVRSARVALGDVAARPWRSDAAEAELVGRPFGSASIAAAGAAAVRGAQTRPENAFKVPSGRTRSGQGTIDRGRPVMTAEPSRRRSGSSASVGTPLDRVDGRLKVTGTATYTAEVPITGLVHAVLLTSTIARGRIRHLDSSAASAAPGVLAVLSHLNAPTLPVLPSFMDGGATVESVQPLQDDRIRYAGQQIAVVVADTLERARHAAELVQVEYDEESPLVDLRGRLDQGKPIPPIFGVIPSDTERGDPSGALAAAGVRIDQIYTTPIEHHNALEPHATIAVWGDDGQTLTVYEATQWVNGVRLGLSQSLGLPQERIRVLSRFIGGGFGAKGAYWPHTTLTALAARQVGRPVKLVLTRAQLYSSTGHRSQTVQQLSLGARRDGTLTAIVHRSTSESSEVGDLPEPAALITRMLYACPNVQTAHRVVPLNVGVPCFMRAPGEAPGAFALESALDELAAALALDPLELRLRNHADADPESGQPWSSKSLRECYAMGAERFGWAGRPLEPRTLRDGHQLLGWGMASATYPVNSFPGATASATLQPDGSAVVRSATQDLGTGAATIFTQIAADELGLPPERVRFELGDSDLPTAPVTGSSATSGTVGPAVAAASAAAREQAIALALDDEESPIHGYTAQDVAVEDGRVFLRHDPARGESYADIIARHGGQAITTSGEDQPNPDVQRFAMHTFGAHFVEVAVDEDFGVVRVRRVVSAMGAGRILNPKTARGQIVGGVIGGIGMALLEQSQLHPTLGKLLSPDLSGYLLAVHADIPDIEALFVDEHDPHVNRLGAKGIGEVGIVGVAAAVANAVYHATGKRIRDLPITPDKLI